MDDYNHFTKFLRVLDALNGVQVPTLYFLWTTVPLILMMGYFYRILLNYSPNFRSVMSSTRREYSWAVRRVTISDVRHL